MKRRDFFTTAAAVAALGTIGGYGCGRERTGVEGAESGAPEIETLAGMTLGQLREKYRHDLFDEYLPFWIEHGIDHERGGVMHGLDHDGTLVNPNKFHWFQGRGVYGFSFLYNHFEQDPQYLEIAQRTNDFMLRYFPEEPDGILWARNVSPNGEVLEGARADDPFGCYFGIEGMFELAYATQDEQLRDRALDLYKRISAFIHSDAVDHEAFNTYMLDLQIGTQFLNYWDSPEVDAITSRAVDVIMNRFYNPDTRMFNEELHNDLSRIEDRRNMANPGHGIEVMWMVMYEAIRTGDQALYDLASRRMMPSMEAGWDFIHDGIVHMINVDHGCYDWGYTQPMGMPDKFYGLGEYHYMKSMWSVAEALVGMLNLYARTGSNRARRYFELNQKCLDEKFSLRPHGYPLHMTFTDRKITFRPHTARKENYHYPRMLMFNLQEIDRLIANGGRPLGLPAFFRSGDRVPAKI